MFLFQEPSLTRYDLHFSIAGVPVRVHPLFWLIALLFGASGDILVLPIWILVVFISVLIHELGHAMAFRRYGQRSQILLHFGGGLTIPEPVRWGGGYANVGMTANQQIFISLAGPFTGFLFAGLVWGAVLLLGFFRVPWNFLVLFNRDVLATFIFMLLSVNIFWGIINLMPVYPLDGGSVARNILIQADPIDGVRKSLWLSVIAGVIVAIIGLIIFRSIFIALLFGILAFQSYQSLQGRSLY